MRLHSPLRSVRDVSAQITGLGLDYGVVRAELAQKPAGPPGFSAEAKAADLRKLIESFAEQGLPTAHIQEILDDPEQQRMWRFAEEQGREAYRLSAHLQHPAPMQTAEASAQARAALDARRTAGAAGADFTGADLSGLDLAGVVLEGTLLESARLAGSTLRGAKLRGAVLAHADLRGADLEGADLRGANLGSAELGGANLSNAELEGATPRGSAPGTHALRRGPDRTRRLLGGSLRGDEFCPSERRGDHVSRM